MPQQGENYGPWPAHSCTRVTHTNHTPVHLQSTRAEQTRTGALHSSRDDLFKTQLDHVNSTPSSSSTFDITSKSLGITSNLLNSAAWALSSASCFSSLTALSWVQFLLRPATRFLHVLVPLPRKPDSCPFSPSYPLLFL